jgi:hypothetical protein
MKLPELKLPERKNIFACHKGLERSVASVEGLNIWYAGEHNPETPPRKSFETFPNGMSALKDWTPARLYSTFHPMQVFFHLIHDPTDGPEAIDAWLASRDLLKSTGYAFEINQTEEIFSFLMAHGVNPYDFLIKIN